MARRNSRPAQTTRALFVDYSIFARMRTTPRPNRARVRQESVTTWEALNQQQRDTFVEHYNMMEAAQNQVRVRARHARKEEEEANRLTNQRTRDNDWPRVIAACEGALNAGKNLKQAQKVLVARSETFRNTVNSIHDNDDVKEHARGKHLEDAEALAEATEHIIVLEGLVDELNLPARRQDGMLKVPEDWIPEFKDERRNKNRRAGFKYNSLDLPNLRSDLEWQGAWMVGEGGHSTTGVWMEVEGEGNIKDRVLRKDTYMSRREWGDMVVWDHTNGDVRDGRGRRPLEVACHDYLENIRSKCLGQSVDVPHLRKYDVDNENLKYSMYLSYCGYGDLDQLITRYQKYNEDQDHEPASIPEPFLWRTFLSLATAGLAMEKGHVNIKDDPKEDWEQIVHRDLKPGNIFLDTPTDRHFELYPTPRVGDFGIAIKTWKEDVLNPTIFLKCPGTPGFSAPEQLPYVDLRGLMPVDRFKQLSHTNVYGVGMIMFSLATLNWPRERLWLGEGTEDGHNIMAERYEESTRDYSNFLKVLIQECLAFNPEDRPTFETILARIGYAISHNFTKGRKDNDYDSDAEVEEDYLMYEEDIYARALTVVELPNRDVSPEQSSGDSESES